MRVYAIRHPAELVSRMVVNVGEYPTFVNKELPFQTKECEIYCDNCDKVAVAQVLIN